MAAFLAQNTSAGHLYPVKAQGDSCPQSAGQALAIEHLDGTKRQPVSWNGPHVTVDRATGSHCSTSRWLTFCECIAEKGKQDEGARATFVGNIHTKLRFAFRNF